MTFWYQINLGIPPLHKLHEGIPVKYRIHHPETFEAINVKRLVGTDMPSWMMMDSEQDLRNKLAKKISELGTTDEPQLKHFQDFSNVLNEYKNLICSDSEKRSQREMSVQRPSFQDYLSHGPSDDSYLDNRNFSILTRAGGIYQAVTGHIRNRRKSISISNVQRQLVKGINHMKDMPGMLKTGFNQLLQSSANNSSDADAHLIAKTQLSNGYEIMRFLMHFIYHVLIGGFFDGVNSMIQIWAVLVIVSSLIRVFQVPDVEVINTAIMSVASVGFFLSFMFFYRVNAKFGPFIVILKEMTVEDLSKWLVLVVLFLAGTGQAMFIILDDPMAFLKPFKWMLGDTEQGSPDSAIDDLM